MVDETIKFKKVIKSTSTGLSIITGVSYSSKGPDLTFFFLMNSYGEFLHHNLEDDVVGIDIWDIPEGFTSILYVATSSMMLTYIIPKAKISLIGPEDIYDADSLGLDHIEILGISRPFPHLGVIDIASRTHRSASIFRVNSSQDFQGFFHRINFRDGVSGLHICSFGDEINVLDTKNNLVTKNMKNTLSLTTLPSYTMRIANFTEFVCLNEINKMIGVGSKVEGRGADPDT